MKSKERQFCTYHDGAVIEHHATGHMVNKLLDEGLLKFRQVQNVRRLIRLERTNGGVQAT